MGDGRAEKIRRDHKVESNGVLVAQGVNAQGKRDLLGIQVCNTENQTTWSDFFESLIQRGWVSSWSSATLTVGW